MIKLLTFDQPLKQAGTGKRHVLLGNGFSRVCRSDLFQYHALVPQGKDRLLAGAKKAFEALKTTDLESVIRTLKHAADLVQFFDAETAEMWD